MQIKNESLEKLENALIDLEPQNNPRDRGFTFGLDKKQPPNIVRNTFFKIKHKLYLSELERITARAKTIGIINLYFLLSEKSK